MPGPSQTPDVDLDRLDAGAPTLATGADQAYGGAFGQAFDPRPAASLALGFVRRASDAVVTTGAAVTGQPLPQLAPQIDPEEANDRYGVPGYLRFNGPQFEDEAAFKAASAREHMFNDNVLARSNASPLLTFGAGLAGSLVNPANVSLMVLTDGLGPGLMEASGARGALDGFGTLGRVANVVGEGALANAPFVAANAAQAGAMGEDYSGGDALRDLAAGAILHTAVHAAFRASNALYGRWGGATADPDLSAGGEPPPDSETAAHAPPSAFTPNPVPADGVPDGVDALPEAARRGAFAMAIEQAADDRPVDVGQYVARELAPPSLDRLDETSAQPDLPSFRPLDDATAITTRGTEVPVRYGVAELGDLTTSHDDALNVNPAYPPELQPRDRTRAGAQARNLQLEQELNPKLLMNDVGAGAGAPIVSPDGVVESGNGRTIALRRSAMNGGDAYARYKAELTAQGLDIAGMDKPVLIRSRTEAMTGAQRSALAREMNADVTERMSATEQAMTDAARIPDASFDQIGEREGPTTSRGFARDFIAKVAPDQANSLAAADGTLSPEGARRIKAAVLARAYGDPRLVGQIFDGEETDGRKLGEALADAAPAWAKLRAAAAGGAIPRQMDITEALTSAMDLVRHAKAEAIALGELIGERLGQSDMFTGDAISPQTEAFLRLFYRDEAFSKPLPAPKIAAALRDYVRQALEVKPGPDLFGATAGEDTARQILANLNDRFARGDAGDIEVKAPGRSDAAGSVIDRPGLDVRQPGDDGDGAGPGVSPQSGDGAEGEGAGVKSSGGSRDGLTAPFVHKGDLWRLSRDELEELLAKTKADEAGLVERALGSREAAKEFTRLDRAMNQTMNPEGADRASREFDAKFGNLTERQKRLIYGDSSDPTPTADDVREVLEAHQDVLEGDDPEWAALQASYAARGSSVADLKAVSEGHGNAQAQRNLVRMGRAYSILRDNGVAEADIPHAMAAAMAKGGNATEAQANELIGHFVQEMKVARRAEPPPDVTEQQQLAAPKHPTAEQLIAADPELKALAADSDRLAAENGVEIETPDNLKPDNLAEAVRAAAVCLEGEL